MLPAFQLGVLPSTVLGALALGAFVGVSGGPGKIEPPHPAPALRVAADSFGQDPALTIGILPNGLHYYLRVNKMPAKRAELYLAVNAGSVLEDEDQQGFAHFLEHMLFNGTTHFPHLGLVDFVEGAGMRFGADLNAFTNFDETVYTLTIPTDEPKVLQQGLQVLEDWAGGAATIDSTEVVAERGVVLGEWRSRLADTATQNAQMHQQAVLYGPDSRYVTRFPIGKPALLEKANPEPLRRFYKDWYRPDLMAVIVVGDFDKAQMEREIRERFGKIPAAAKPRPRFRPLPVSRSEPVVDVYTSDVWPAATVYWPRPPMPTEPQVRVRQELMEDLLFQLVQRKLLKLRKVERRPFFQAQTGLARLERSLGRAYTVAVLASPDSLESALAAVLTEFERIAQHGVPAPTLELQKAALLRQLESAADEATAVPSKSLAEEYVWHYLRGEGVLLSPQQKLALARTLLPAITPEALAEAARFWRRDEGRLVMFTVPRWAHVRPPTRESVLALIDSVMKAPIQADTAPQVAGADGPLLATPPKPGKIVRERRYAAAGITEWTLSNGARVLYKPTNADPDQLLLRAKSLGGFSLVDDTLFFSPGRLVGKMMTEAAGLGKLDRTALEKQLTTTALREFKVEINYTDEEIALGGSPKDLETLFQILYLQFTAPRLDTTALAVWKRYGKVGVDEAMDINDRIAGALSRGNPRLAPMSPALVDLANLDQAMAVYRDRFGDAGDFTFTIVGAAEPARVRPLVERYLASLPSAGRAEREQPKDPGIKPWNGISRVTEKVQPVLRASTALAYDGLFPADPSTYLDERQRLDAVITVLRRRLRERLREELGATYTVGVGYNLYVDPKLHYRVVIHFDADPKRIDALIPILMSEIDSVRTAGATPVELAMVSRIQQRSIETALQDDNFWVGAIQQFDRLGLPFDAIPRLYSKPLIASDEIRTAAQRYLPSNSYLQLTLLPTDEVVAQADSAKEQP